MPMTSMKIMTAMRKNNCKGRGYINYIFLTHKITNLVGIGAEVGVSELKHLDEHDHGHDVPEVEMDIEITDIYTKDNYMKVVSNWNVMLVGQM